MTTIIILTVIGILLILAELILPGGIIGAVGGICLLIAVVLTFKNYGPTMGAISFLSVLVFSFLVLVVWVKNFNRLPFTKNLVHSQSLDDNTEKEWLKSLIGQTGTALTMIAPSGHGEVNGQRIDVITETGSIDRGKTIKIVATRGPSIIVEEVA